MLMSCFFWGCSPKVTTVVSPVNLPEDFPATGNGMLPDKWWETFGDKTLNSYVERALGENFDLLIAWDRLAQTEALAVKEGAALWPEVNASGQASRTREEMGNVANYYNRYNLGVSVSYELDLWGRIHAAHQGALLDVQASREDLDATAIVLSARITQTWYQLAEAIAQVDLIDQQIESNQKVLALITTRFRQGQISAADVLRQRQLLESSHGQLILAQEQIELLLHELSVLLGTAPGSLTQPQDAWLMDLPILPVVPVPSELIQRRPDVRSAFINVQAADQRVAQAIADQFPRISISAGAETSGMEVRDLFDNWLANIAGNLSQPIFDADRRAAEVDRTRAALSQAIHEYGRVILNSLQEVQDALTQERQQADYLLNLGKQLELSRKVLERTRESYIKGQLDYLRVLESLVSRQSLERNYIKAKQQLISRRIDLCQAIAGSWQMDRPEITTLDIKKSAVSN
ncbi:MAG: TolC family protein [Sedimentisphaerales bacterium]|nr:TolC family protein [Sedimentisphaerales bacterium]